MGNQNNPPPPVLEWLWISRLPLEGAQVIIRALRRSEHPLPHCRPRSPPHRPTATVIRLKTSRRKMPLTSGIALQHQTPLKRRWPGT
jgi:hypothetical protein